MMDFDKVREIAEAFNRAEDVCREYPTVRCGPPEVGY